jgi:hypothetical protein
MKIAIVDPDKKMSGLVLYKARKAMEKYGGKDLLESFSYESRKACLLRYAKDGPFDDVFAFHGMNNFLDIGTNELVGGIRDIETNRGIGKACNVNRVYPGGVSQKTELSYYGNAGGRAFNGNPAVMAVELGRYFENLLI